jgi:hypothetical protein
MNEEHNQIKKHETYVIVPRPAVDRVLNLDGYSQKK